MSVLRLGHVNIRTARLEETVAFYERVLGLTRGEALTVHDQTNFVWLYDQRGAPVVHVNRPPAGEPAAESRGVLDHFAFDCDDREGFAERLEREGVGFQVVNARGGIVQYNFRDPNGLKVELTFAP